VAALEVERGGARLFSAVQSTWNLLETSAGAALRTASRRELTVIVKEALANGRLVAQPPPVLQQIAQRLGVGPDAVALAAAAAQPWANRVLLGAASTDQLRANLRATGLVLDPADLDLLTTAALDPGEYWQTRSAMPWQ